MAWVRRSRDRRFIGLALDLLYALSYTRGRKHCQSWCIQMDFKSASDALFHRVSHEVLAEQIGVSVATIRQARLDVSAKAHRHPPRDWEKAVIGLAENRIRHYHELIGALATANGPADPA